MSARKIVATLGIQFDDRGGFGIDVGRSLARDLRRLLTYWDGIDSPVNNFVSFPLGPDWDEMLAAGVGMHSPVIGQGLDRDIVIGAHCAVFADHSKREPGVWSMAQLGRSALYVPSGYAEQKSTLEVELFNCLPVPDDTVHIAEILNFKVKRSAELQAFRATMDELYQSVVSAGDVERARVTAKDKIDAAIADVARSMNESFLARFNSIAKYGYVVANAVAMAFTGDLSHTAKAIAGASAAAIGLKVQSSSVPKGVGLGGFSYVQRVVEDMGRR